MQRNGLRAHSAARLAERVRLGGLLHPRGGRLFGRAQPQPYAEDEVRDRIYGWHSGSVEPPQPLASRARKRAQPPAPPDAR